MKPERQRGYTLTTYWTILGCSWVSSSYDYRRQGMVTRHIALKGFILLLLSAAAVNSKLCFYDYLAFSTIFCIFGLPEEISFFLESIFFHFGLSR